ncbi:hypothetical protein THRCLA_09457, partial [Thraustotheca clavata]
IKPAHSSWDEQPIKPAQNYHEVERPIQPAQSSAWDERPIKPAQSYLEDEHPIQPARANSWDDRPIKPAQSTLDEQPIEQILTTSSWEDRPIQPAQNIVVDQSVESVQITPSDEDHLSTVDERSVESIESIALDDRPIQPAKSLIDEQPIPLTNSWDEQPIKPARSEISQDPQEIPFYEQSIKTNDPMEQEIIPAHERRSSSACTEWEPIVQRRRSSLEEDVVIRTDEIVSFESDDTDEESLPKFATRYDEMVAELSDFNIMWLLQLDLLEELYHHLELHSVSLSEMKRLMEMMEIKASHPIHAKVIGSFLRLMPFITTYYKSEGVLLTPHMEHLLPPFMALFQERSKAAISTLETNLKSWFSVLDVVLILNSLETAIVDLEMTELGIARLVTWFAQEMPMTNGVTKASSRLCDALVQLTSHRATKVRNASTDILANILGHNKSGEVPSWLANGTPQCLAARVSEKFPSHPLVSQLQSMQDIVIPPQEEPPAEAPIETPKENKPSKLKSRQITKPWLKKKEPADDTEEQPAKPWLTKKETPNDAEDQPAKPWLKKKVAAQNDNDEQPAKPWLKKKESPNDEEQQPAKPWLKNQELVNDTDEQQPAKPWLKKKEVVNDTEGELVKPWLKAEVSQVPEDTEANEPELKTWQQARIKNSTSVTLDEKTSDSMGIASNSSMEADVTSSSSLLPSVDMEISQCDKSFLDNDTNNQVRLKSTSFETDESASYSEDENMIVILDDEGFILSEEMDASEMHFGSDILDKTHDKNAVIFAIENVDAVPEKTSPWSELPSERGMKHPDQVRNRQENTNDSCAKTPSTSGDDEQPLLSSTLMLEDDNSFYEANVVGNVVALPTDIENVGDKEKMLVDIEAMLQAFKEEESGEEDLGGKQSWFFVDEHTDDDDEDYPNPAILGESDNEDSGWEETSRASLPLLGNTVYDILENHPLEFFALDKPHEDKAALEQILQEHHGFDEMLPPDMPIFIDTPQKKAFEHVLNSVNEVTIFTDDTKSNEIIKASHDDDLDSLIIPFAKNDFDDPVASLDQEHEPRALKNTTKEKFKIIMKEDYDEKDMVPNVNNTEIDKEIRKSVMEAFDDATVGTDDDESSSHQGYFRGRIASDFDEFFPEDEDYSERVDDGWSRVPSSIHSRRNSDVSNYGMDFHKHDFPGTNDIVVPEEEEEEDEPFIPENIDRFDFFDGFETVYPASLEANEAMEVLYIPLGWWIQECHDILVTSEHDEQASLAELDSAFCMLEVTFPTVEGDEDTLFYEESSDDDVAMPEHEWATICAYQENWRRAKNSLVVDFQSAVEMILNFDCQRKDEEAEWASANNQIPEQRSKSLTLRRNSIYGSLTPAVKRHSESSLQKAQAHLTPTPSALIIPPRIRTSAASPHLARSSSSRASSEASDSPRGSFTTPCHFQRGNSETSNSPRTSLTGSSRHSFTSESTSKPSLTRLGRYSPDPTESPRQSITKPSRLSRAPSDASISSRSSRLESPRKSLAMPSSRLARSASESIDSPRKSLAIPTSRLSRSPSTSIESPRKSLISRSPSTSIESPRKSMTSLESPRKSMTLPTSRLSRAPSDAIETPRKSLSMQPRPSETRHSISAIPSGLKKPVTASTRSLLPSRARSTSSAPSSGLRPPTILSRLKKSS